MPDSVPREVYFERGELLTTLIFAEIQASLLARPSDRPLGEVAGMLQNMFDGLPAKDGGFRRRDRQHRRAEDRLVQAAIRTARIR